jgi:glycosyltransferase involved in cell wall biosynthesis
MKENLTENKKFSIVIPIYNTGEFLNECIDSVINQTYSNLEIILVNDGSPDNSDEICKHYQNIDNRIKYFYKENEGVSIARNLGIANATGEYVYCLDSDDCIDKYFIENIVQSFQDNDLVLVGENYCSKNLKVLGTIATCGLAFKKSFLDKFSDVRYPEKMQPCEDGIFNHELLALTNKIGKCPQTLYFYRRHAASNSHTIDNRKLFKEIPTWFNILEKFYTKYNLWESHKLHLLAFITKEPLNRLKHRFNKKEKKFLFKFIKNFIKTHDLLNCEDIELLNRNFQNFIRAKNYNEFIQGRPETIIQKIFSIRNESSKNIKRKVVTILGIKIKFKIEENLKISNIPQTLAAVERERERERE